jgi:hypothetical protein
MPTETSRAPLRRRCERGLSCGDRGFRPADAGRARGEDGKRASWIGELEAATVAPHFEDRIARRRYNKVSEALRFGVGITAAVEPGVWLGDGARGESVRVFIKPGAPFGGEPLAAVLAGLPLGLRGKAAIADFLGEETGAGADAAIPPLAGGEDARRVRELEQRFGVVDAAGSHREDRGDFGPVGHRARPPSLTPYVVVDVKQSVRFKPDC